MLSIIYKLQKMKLKICQPPAKMHHNIFQSFHNQTDTATGVNRINKLHHAKIWHDLETRESEQTLIHKFSTFKSVNKM